MSILVIFCFKRSRSRFTQISNNQNLFLNSSIGIQIIPYHSLFNILIYAKYHLFIGNISRHHISNQTSNYYYLFLKQTHQSMSTVSHVRRWWPVINGFLGQENSCHTIACFSRDRNVQIDCRDLNHCVIM